MRRKVERYGIYVADLNPTRGGEMAKARPVVVISQDAMNRFLDTVVVCLLTSKIHDQWRSRVQCTCAGRDSEIAVDQIRTITKARLARRIDRLSPAIAAQVRAVVVEMYGR